MSAAEDRVEIDAIQEYLSHQFKLPEQAKRGRDNPSLQNISSFNPQLSVPLEATLS